MSQKSSKSATKPPGCLNCEKKELTYLCSCGKRVCDLCLETKEYCPHCKFPFELDKKSQKKEEIAKPGFDKPVTKASSTPSKTSKPSQSTLKGKAINYAELSKIRVIQKNLVYMIGLAPTLAKEEVLKKPEYLGQYGNISKVVINKNNAYNPNGPHGPSYSAYVTFSNEKEATIAIFAIDEYEVLERVIRASYGTTKYCTYFLKDQECINPDCLYLHAFGKERDFFTKDPITSNKDIFIDQQKIAITNFKRYHPEITKQKLVAPEKPVFPSVESLTAKLYKITKEYEENDLLQSTPEIEENKRRSIQIMKKNKIDINVPEKEVKKDKKSVSKIPKKPEKLINITDNFFEAEPQFSKKDSKRENSESQETKANLEDAPASKSEEITLTNRASESQEIVERVTTPKNLPSDGDTEISAFEKSDLKEEVVMKQADEESLEDESLKEKDSQSLSLKNDNDLFVESDRKSPSIDEVVGLNKSQSYNGDVRPKSEEKNNYGAIRPNFLPNFGFTKNSRFAFANSVDVPESNENDEEFKDLSTSIQNYLRNPFSGETTSDCDKNKQDNWNSDYKGFSTFDDKNQKEENMTFNFNSYNEKGDNNTGSSYGYFKNPGNIYRVLASGINYNFNFGAEPTGKNETKGPIRNIIINHNNISYNVNNNINLNNNYFGFPGQGNK